MIDSLIDRDQLDALHELASDTGELAKDHIRRAIAGYIEDFEERDDVMTSHDWCRWYFGQWAAATPLDRQSQRACREAFSAIRQDLRASNGK